MNKKRRSLLQAVAAGSATTFMGPWAVNHAWAQAATKKPLVIGLTMDASGQYGASGGEERSEGPSRRCTWIRRQRPPPDRAWPSG